MWAQCNVKEEDRKIRVREGDETIEKKVRVMHSLEPTDTGSLQKLKIAGELTLSRGSKIHTTLLVHSRLLISTSIRQYSGVAIRQ